MAEFSGAIPLLENTGEASHSSESGDVKTLTKRSSLHAFTVALALSIHSIFEGLALGLEEQTSQVRNNIYCIPKPCKQLGCTCDKLLQFESLRIFVGIPFLSLSDTAKLLALCS